MYKGEEEEEEQEDLMALEWLMRNEDVYSVQQRSEQNKTEEKQNRQSCVEE